MMCIFIMMCSYVRRVCLTMRSGRSSGHGYLIGDCMPDEIEWGITFADQCCSHAWRETVDRAIAELPESEPCLQQYGPFDMRATSRRALALAVTFEGEEVQKRSV